MAATGLRKVAGVTEARVDFPLAALGTLPGVRVFWSEERLALGGLRPPGVLVFHRRFLVEPEVQANLERLAAAGWVLVSDQDDDPRHWREYVESDFYAYRCVHAVSVSTEPLARLMRQWNPHVAVLPNGVLALPDRPPRADGRVRIFFGALNRQDDWRSMLPALQGALKRLRDQVEVVVVHDCAFHDALADGVARTFHPTLPPAEYLRVLASCDLALLPLADTPFNRLKSDLKLVECAAAGVVPICSPVVYGSDPHHHEVAVFAETPEQWAAALERLVKESEERARRAARGRAWVAVERMHGRLAPARAAWYRRLLAERSRLEEERQARLAAWRARFPTP
ncbi:MAG: hypothetical protein KatS3mg124_0475 [Porticoccaceae bacterium]|nr:MAG: hypothetical protein KatS3mg124_0475 [Porticoccaceae bacterium]